MAWLGIVHTTYQSQGGDSITEKTDKKPQRDEHRMTLSDAHAGCAGKSGNAQQRWCMLGLTGIEMSCCSSKCSAAGSLGRRWARLLTGQRVTLSKCLLTFGTGFFPCGGRPLHSAVWTWASLAGVTRSCCTEPSQNHRNLRFQRFSLQIETDRCTVIISSCKATQ